MFEAAADFRQAEDKDSVRWILDRAQKLARACLDDTRVVTVCDREGDFWEMISRAEETGAALLIRASRGRQRRVALRSGGDADLWDHVLETEPRCRIVVPACGGPNRRKGREADAVLHARGPGCPEGGEGPIRMIAVSALEENPPHHLVAGKKGEPWMLLTTEADRKTARTILRWYELRWKIERFFHALKVGTRIEDRRRGRRSEEVLRFRRRVPGLGPLHPGPREAERPNSMSRGRTSRRSAPSPPITASSFPGHRRT